MKRAIGSNPTCVNDTLSSHYAQVSNELNQYANPPNTTPSPKPTTTTKQNNNNNSNSQCPLCELETVYDLPSILKKRKVSRKRKRVMFRLDPDTSPKPTQSARAKQELPILKMLCKARANDVRPHPHIQRQWYRTRCQYYVEVAGSAARMSGSVSSARCRCIEILGETH